VGPPSLKLGVGVKLLERGMDMVGGSCLFEAGGLVDVFCIYSSERGLADTAASAPCAGDVNISRSGALCLGL
jgi:hypothetical protein